MRRLDAAIDGTAVAVHPGQEFICGLSVGAARVRVADFGHEEFEEAHAGTLAGGGSVRPGSAADVVGISLIAALLPFRRRSPPLPSESSHHASPRKDLLKPWKRRIDRGAVDVAAAEKATEGPLRACDWARTDPYEVLRNIARGTVRGSC